MSWRVTFSASHDSEAVENFNGQPGYSVVWQWVVQGHSHPMEISVPLRVKCSEKCKINKHHVCPVTVKAKRWIPWLDTLLHSGSGKVYCPCLILFFIPGEIAAPWLL